MVLSEPRYKKTPMITAVSLIGFGMMFPLVFQPAWFNVTAMIRKALGAGDSGHLILASALTCLLFSVQSMFFFLGVILLPDIFDSGSIFRRVNRFMGSFFLILFLHWANSLIHELPWEPVSTVLAAAVSLFLFERVFKDSGNYFQVTLVSVQVFFAFQWLNIMPALSAYHIGQSDLPLSVKIAGLYLQSGSVLNFIGFAFFLPVIFSASITTILFINYYRSMRIIRENHEKESQIQYMKAKVMENRIYQEIYSLVHDLKTPLATVRGLNSLLPMTGNNGKLEEYSEHIENSVVKMNEMISGILYESARQTLKPEELINYIRAQLPLEDESISIDIQLDDDLPELYINKVRTSRAVLNLLENAIVAPCEHRHKKIGLRVAACDGGVLITIRDNGTGIGEDDIGRIWEAGFSTRNTSGLGLPFAKQIIENHNGWIDLKSYPREGTVVTLFLPSAADASVSSC